MSYEFILTRTEGRVAIAQFNRPKAYNALSPELLQELMHALEAFDTDAGVGCIVVTGNAKVFSAAGLLFGRCDRFRRRDRRARAGRFASG